MSRIIKGRIEKSVKHKRNKFVKDIAYHAANAVKINVGKTNLT